MKKEIGKKKSNRIKAILIIGLMLFATGSVVADQMQIFAKEETPLSPLGAGPPSDAGVHIGGNNDAAIVKIVEINSDADDGYMTQFSDVNYNTVWTNPIAVSVIANADDMYLGGQAFQNPYYIIWRCGIFFDTSSIPSDAVITSAKLTVVLFSDRTTTDYNVVVQNGQPTYPSKPIVVTDYDKSYYSGDGGSYDTSGLPAVGQPFDINLNATGISWINGSGITKFMFRSSRDITGISPTGEENLRIYSFEKGTTFIPKLTVSYYTPPQPIRILGDVRIGGG